MRERVRVREGEGERERGRVSECVSCTLTYQHILKFDVSVQEALSMKKSYSFNHIQSNLHPRTKIQPNLRER